MILRRRRNTALAKIPPGVVGGVALLAMILTAPIVVGAVAGSLLGYGWRKGIGAGLVFSLVAGTVRGLLGARGAGRRDRAPEPVLEPEPDDTEP